MSSGNLISQRTNSSVSGWYNPSAPGRGRLAVGAAADVVVFDPDTVGCSPLRRVNDLPAGADRLVCDAIGVQTVIVNGTVIREDGRDALADTAPLPGRLLRGGRTA